MDAKKKLKISKKNGMSEIIDTTPKKDPAVSSEMTGNDMPDLCGSPDFLSSQECFSVGWDWSGQLRGNNNPSIRFVERPIPKKKKSVQLLECQRPRRIVKTCDPDMFDASIFVDQLKSLASGLKRLPESTSPVASPPHHSFMKQRDPCGTPKSVQESLKSSSNPVNIDTTPRAASTLSKRSSEKSENVKEDLNVLLDDSLGADLLKFTQDMEQDFKQKESKTPHLADDLSIDCASSKRKNRLSLGCKKIHQEIQRNVCRRISDIDEENSVTNSETRISENTSLTSLASVEKKQDKQNNNVPPRIEFDEIDEATLLTVGELEEREMVKLKESSGRNASSSNSESTGTSPFLEDDEFVSPDLLGMLDEWEKKATQEQPKSDLCTAVSEENAASGERKSSTDEALKKIAASTAPLKQKLSSYKRKSPTGESLAEAKNKREAIENPVTEQPRKKTLSLANRGLKYTPEEIEKKRQEAIKKRLQVQTNHC